MRPKKQLNETNGSNVKTKIKEFVYKSRDGLASYNKTIRVVTNLRVPQDASHTSAARLSTTDAELEEESSTRLSSPNSNTISMEILVGEYLCEYTLCFSLYYYEYCHLFQCLYYYH